MCPFVLFCYSYLLPCNIISFFQLTHILMFWEKAMAPHSSTLAWKIPWMEEPGGLQSMGSRSRTRLSSFTFTFHFHALEKEMATLSGVLAWRIPGTGQPGGLPSLGSHRVGHDWSDLAAVSVAVGDLALDLTSWRPDQHWEERNSEGERKRRLKNIPYA